MDTKAINDLFIDTSTSKPSIDLAKCADMYNKTIDVVAKPEEQPEQQVSLADILNQRIAKAKAKQQQ